MKKLVMLLLRLERFFLWKKVEFVDIMAMRYIGKGGHEEVYIKRIAEENVGPIEKIELVLPFQDNIPKPIIIVGENGTGKSTIVSNIVDSFYEIAATAYSDARKHAVTEGYEYYKQISPIEIHVGKQYLYSYIRYEDQELPPIEYVFKSGTLKIDDFKNIVRTSSQQISWKEEEGNYKNVTSDGKNVEKMLKKDILCYFGPDRYEKPVWMGNQYYETEDQAHITVKPRFSGRMESPILVSGMTNKTLQWLLDVIVDSRGDIVGNGQGGLLLERIS
jgi:predicted ATPase